MKVCKAGMISILLVLTFSTYAQLNKAAISGVVKAFSGKTPIAYVNVVLKKEQDSSFVAGTITNDKGQFILENITEGSYLTEISSVGYVAMKIPVLVGKLNNYFDLGAILLKEESKTLEEVVVTSQQEGVHDKMDKKSYKVGDNISQVGGSVLQSIKNLPGVTIDEGGKILLRGSSKVTILVDGKQTALTGFGNQTALDNIPASGIERIEIINNPSAKFDANGNAGIINIVYKKSKQNGFNGKAQLTAGLGALWIKEESFPGTRSQHQATPKINPSLSINHRKNKINAFFQGDYLYTKTLNKNEFTDRFYDNGDIVRQQVQRNRITTIGIAKAGIDWSINSNNSITFSGLYSREVIKDYGDIPYYDEKLTEQKRLWQFFEDEVLTAATASANYLHKFQQPGHIINASVNYTFHREDEKYFLVNNMPSYVGKDTFMLIADETVADVNVDYVRPLKKGRFETGLKFRWRHIPTNMQFFPGFNSPLDTNAAGWARYTEVIPAVYGNYIYESKYFEMEAGLRMEYVNLEYIVNPQHNTYKSDGYNYLQPFPTIRLGFNPNENSKFSLFFNRRVDRPDEGDIRIFPKYDDPELLKVGNPALRPQFTQSFELGYKTSLGSGFLYTAVYHRTSKNSIIRINTTIPGSNIIYAVFQNAKNAYNTGIEFVANQKFSDIFTLNMNANIYQNVIGAFTTTNKYPAPVTFTADKEKAYSGNVKLNSLFSLAKSISTQVTVIYLAPDIVPQGKIGQRFSVDFGIKKSVQKNNGELFLNATDLFNTLRIEREIRGDDFHFTSTDYYETQVFRLGYSYKF